MRLWSHPFDISHSQFQRDLRSNVITTHPHAWWLVNNEKYTKRSSTAHIGSCTVIGDWLAYSRKYLLPM